MPYDVYMLCSYVEKKRLNKIKISSQDFVMRNIPVNLRSLPIIAFALEGLQKSLLKVEKRPWQPSYFSE